MNNRANMLHEIIKTGGQLALEYYQQLHILVIQEKGHQDFVSMADKAVETHIRSMIATHFPDDGILGEECADIPTQSGYLWVIDPIDGTANFINNIPQWCVTLAVVKDNITIIGAIYDPVHNELFFAQASQGASLNNEPLLCPTLGEITKGSVGTGFPNQSAPQITASIISQILNSGGVYHRNASGALSLAYVAAGRLIGYIEEHMHPWDCLAGILIIKEAGGFVEQFNEDIPVTKGRRVIAARQSILGHLIQIGNKAGKNF